MTAYEPDLKSDRPLALEHRGEEAVAIGREALTADGAALTAAIAEVKVMISQGKLNIKEEKANAEFKLLASMAIQSLIRQGKTAEAKARGYYLEKALVVSLAAEATTLRNCKPAEALEKSTLLKNTILAAVNRADFAEDLVSVESAIAEMMNIEGPSFFYSAFSFFVLIGAFIWALFLLNYFFTMTEFFLCVSLFCACCLGLYIGFRGGRR